MSQQLPGWLSGFRCSLWMFSTMATARLISEAQSGDQFVHLIVGGGYESLEFLGTEGMLPVWWRQKLTASQMRVCLYLLMARAPPDIFRVLPLLLHTPSPARTSNGRYKTPKPTCTSKVSFSSSEVWMPASSSDGGDARPHGLPFRFLVIGRRAPSTDPSPGVGGGHSSSSL